MLGFLLNGAALGFAAGAAPGAFQTFIITESLARGWRAGLRVALAPLLSDGPIIALTTLALRQVPTRFLGAISLAGTGVLLWLAWGLLRQWRSGTTLTPDGASGPAAPTRSLWRGALINATSPGAYLFWGTVGGPLLLAAWAESAATAGVLLLGFYGTFLLFLAALALLSHQLRRLPAGAVRLLWLVSALLLAGMAVVLASNGARLLAAG